jgi:hypothetical protein
MLWLLLAAVAAIASLWWWGAGPVDNEIGDAGVGRMFRLLIARGVNGATMTVCARQDRRRRLVFTKYVRAPGDVGVRASLPPDEWVTPHMAPLRAELRRRGIAHADDAGGGLAFEFGRDAGGAHVVASLLFESTLGLSLRRDCVAYFRRVVIDNRPSHTGVDEPDVGWG